MRRVGLFAGLTVALLAGRSALAQTGTITGRITSTEGAAPVAGAQVIVRGTTAGTQTTTDGRYSLAVRAGTYTVIARRIGFAPDSVTGVVVTEGGTATADLALAPTATVLSQVVSIGYGERAQRNITGSVAAVNSKEFNTGRVVSPEQLIEGKVAGVHVIGTNEPGGGINVRVRGGTSVNAQNEPLFVIDGVPMPVGGGFTVGGRNPLNFLNPDDIESITVLKDAASTAIYGSRGANGVVLIRTRSGATQTSGVEITSSISQSDVVSSPDMLNAAQFRAVVQQYKPSIIDSIGTANTDWLGAVEQRGVGQEHTIAFGGRRQDMNYRLSLNYLDQDGILRGSTAKRVATNLTYADRLFDQRLEVNAHVSGAKLDDRFTPSPVLGNAINFIPTAPIYNADGTYFSWNPVTQALRVGNPVSQLALISDASTGYRSIGNIQGKYRFPFLEGLSGNVNLGYDVAMRDRTTFNPSNEWTQEVGQLGGTLTRNRETLLNTLLETYGDYTRDFDPLSTNVDLTAGYTWEQNNRDNPYMFAQGLPSDLLGPNGLVGAKLQRSTIYKERSRLISGFARLNATVRDRYLLMLSVRRDGSSKFGPLHQWGWFPAAGLGWRLSEEPFLQNRIPSLSDLKLRYSWGVNGNQGIPSYQAYAFYVVGNNFAQAQFGDQFVNTIRPSAYNPGIRWEQTASHDLGLDYGFLNNRITGTIDYYAKKTTDLLFNVPIAAGTNLSNFLYTNIGSVQNRGWEFGLNARVLEGGRSGLTWDASFTASTNSNKLLSINSVGEGVQQVFTGLIAGGVGNYVQVLQPGVPVNSYYVYHQIGDTSGVPIYEDINKDGKIDINDRRPFHSPAPKWLFGHSSNLRYGNVDASFTLRASLGNYVYNNVASNLGWYGMLNVAGAPINLHSSVLKTGFKDSQFWSDVYVEDASFLRMDNIQVGYTFHNLRQVNQLRLFGTVQNVFTLTNYTGVDPEAGLNGIDNTLYPRARTFLVGANVGF